MRYIQRRITELVHQSTMFARRPDYALTDVRACAKKETACAFTQAALSTDYRPLTTVLDRVVVEFDLHRLIYIESFLFGFKFGGVLFQIAVAFFNPRDARKDGNIESAANV